MKEIIRKNTFETNSSSTHSLSISNANVYESLTPNENGEIVVPLNDFGWEVEDFHDAMTKLSYMMIYIRDWVHGQEKQIFLDYLTNVVCEHTGATSIRLLEEHSQSYCNGYIDHQSVEDHQYHYLFDESTDILKQFIFCNHSYLHTDNDNG